jgi:hypothetical protein
MGEMKRKLSQVESIAVRMNTARLEVVRLKKEMGDLQCQHELANVMTSELELPGWNHGEATERPCWKGERDDDGGYGYYHVGDERGWCDPCLAREKLRQPLSAARRKLGALTAALWRAVAKVEGTRS